MQVFGNSAAGAGWVAAMRRDDFPAAWRISDAVLAARDPATRDDPGLPYHLRWVWDGGRLDGRDVLVRCYHGLGDTLQFARYLAPLRARAARVTLEVQAPLLPLLQGAADRAAAFDPANPLPPAEAEVEIMELAHALRLRPEAMHAAIAVPPPLRTGATGLCWQAGGWDRDRSVPVSDLVAAARAPGGHALVSLQRGPAAGQATDAAFLNPGDTDPDIARTAALIAGARRVVTVDTMVAHLAGTLGAPTLVLLRHEADWRWGAADTTVWYPSLRLLRQHAAGDWSGPLATLSRLAAS